MRGPSISLPNDPVARGERGATLRFAASVAFAALLPLAGFVVLPLTLDPAVKVPHPHFYVSVGISLLGLGIFLLIGRVGVRLRNLQVALLALSYLALSTFFAIHGLTTPGVWLGGNAIVSASATLGLFLNSAFLFLASLPPDGPVMAAWARHRRAVWNGSAALILSVLLLVLVVPGPVDDSAAFLRGASSALTAAGIALSIAACARFFVGYRFARLPLQGALTYATAWLAVAHWIAFQGSTWHLSWWLYHLLLIAGTAAVLASFAFQYSTGKRPSAVLRSLFLADPLTQIEFGLPRGVAGLVAATEARDPYTAGHSLRVARLAVEIGRVLDLPPEQLRALALGGLLHDAGKIGVPDTVLNKPGPLLPEEREVIRRHPVFGYRMARSAGVMAEELQCILHHHERWDGSGYPAGLRGTQTPFLARLLAVADVYDALSTDRVYRPAWTPQRTLEYIRQHAGSLFDPECVAALERVFGGGAAGAEVAAARALASRA